MSGPPRFNPSRRSRFRPQGPATPPRLDAPPGSPADAPPDEAGYEPVPDKEPVAQETWPASSYAAKHHADEPDAQAHAAPKPWPADAYTQGSSPSAETGNTPSTASASASGSGAGDDELPPAFQLRKVYDGAVPPNPGVGPLLATLGSIVLLALGLTGGYLYGVNNAPSRLAVPRAVTALPGKSVVPEALDDKTQQAVDAAFEATKQRHYEDAKKQFDALHQAHPEWPSMAIESARATLYQFDAQATGSILTNLTRNGPTADAEFLKALMRLTHKEFDQANQAFAAAIALDPARPDFYYFWGECLRSQGKPREAAAKFQAALLRNQYETSEDLYQLKLWMSQIQADQEDAGGTNSKIEDGLAMKPRPPYSAVFAAAAREIKAARFTEAAKYLGQGQQLTEPVVYHVILQDPTFLQESWRPELAQFYK